MALITSKLLTLDWDSDKDTQLVAHYLMDYVTKSGEPEVALRLTVQELLHDLVVSLDSTPEAKETENRLNRLLGIPEAF